MDSQTHWETDKSPARWTVRVSGDLDLETGPRLREYLAAQISRCPSTLVLDLVAVSFCDSSGLQALVATLRRARLLERGFLVRLVKEGRLHRLLELAGVVDLFALEFGCAAAAAEAQASRSIVTRSAVGRDWQARTNPAASSAGSSA